jgi:hypothetical protein
MSDNVAGPRQRMTLTNIETNETVEVQFNPEEFRSQVTVNFARKVVQGHSSHKLQYGSTGNRTFELNLFWIGHTIEEVGQINDARLFVESLCYVPRGERSTSASTPRVLLLWPNFLAMQVKVVRHGDAFFRFARSGQPTGFRIRVGFEEDLDRRLTMEDVRLQGYERGDLGL